MKRLLRALLFGLCLVLLVASLQAKRKRPSTPGAQSDNATPAPEPTALPAETAPKFDPQAAPSLSLGPFIDTHLGKILAPLGERAFEQPEVIASLQAGYAVGMAAAPANRKPAYQLALAVCNAMSGAITERQTATTNLRGALATRSSESQQPRGGGEAVAKAKAGDAFFLDSQKNNWTTRAGQLRQNIAALYLRERQAEARIGPWDPPVPPPASAAAPTPAASVPTPAGANAYPPGSDPVAGKWKWDGYIDVTINGDHTLGGRRHGRWAFTTTTDGKRHYEFYYDKHPDWVDRLTLSTDGRSLEGADHDGKYVSAQRK